MQITREELETQGVFIPTKDNDELLARFRAGSKILLEVLTFTYSSQGQLWCPFIIQHTDHYLGINPNASIKFSLKTNLDIPKNILDECPILVSVDDFKTILECLEKNC